MSRNYFPIAHSELDEQQNFVRNAVVNLRKGDIELPVNIKSVPTNADAVALQGELLARCRSLTTKTGH